MAIDRKTVVIGLLSYTAWGLFPIYWRLVTDLSPWELLVHRFVWSFLFYLAVFLLVSQNRSTSWKGIRLSDLGMSVTAAVLLGANWLLFIHAVQTNRVLEASLAYFLNPILNVGVGRCIFREKIPWGLRIAIVLAGIGIGTQFLDLTDFPWIALLLAFSFCAYGAVKKAMRLESNLGLVVESGAMLLPAIALAVFFRQQSPVPQLQLHHYLFLVGTGVITGIPLVLFSYAAQRLPYSLLGMMQFVAPTLQFLVAYVVFGEPLTTSRVFAFSFVGAGVLFYLADRLRVLLRTAEVDASLREMRSEPCPDEP